MTLLSGEGMGLDERCVGTYPRGFGTNVLLESGEAAQDMFEYSRPRSPPGGNQEALVVNG